MEYLTIKAMLLVVTMVVPEQGIQHVIATPENYPKCKYIAEQLVMDERRSTAAESKMDKKDIEPRVRTIAVSCTRVDIPFSGESASYRK